MLALGVGNAWGEKITDYSNIGTGKIYYIGATTGGTDYYLSVNGASTSNSIAGTAVTDKTNAATFVFTGSGTSWNIKFADYDNYLSLSSSKANGKVMVVSSAATFTASNQSQKLRLSIGSYSIQKNNSGTQFGSYGNTQTDIWLEEVPGSSEPTTQYTIKWHTAKGVTTDVTLNEGATITKPATDPAMTGYEFMGWTASCDVASDGSDFTALTDFGTADSDKDFYAVFAVATTTGGGESTPTEVTDVLNRETTGVTGTSYTAWTGKTASSSAIYAGQSAGGNSSIQLRSSNSNSGIVTTTSGGKAKKVVVVWQSSTSAGRTIDIYGKNSAYTQATDLYNSTNQGTKLGSIKCGTSTEFTISGDYEYIGIRSNSGALYLTSVSITWASEGTGGGTTTYSDYITTCASDIEFVELGDDFKWSATEAEVTIDATDNVFPTLTNTHNVPVTYSSTDDAIASIAADGTVTLNKEGTVTITAKYAGGTSAGTGKEYKAKTVTYSLKVNKAAPVASGTTYVKVTSTAGITDGEYLIVYETGKVAFDGSLATLDAISNTIEVEITDGKIAGTNYIDLSTFTIDATAGTIKSASGYYIGQTSDANGLKANTSTKYTNDLTIGNDGTATVKSGGAYLRYNSDANNWRFRYYKSSSYSGQKAIALYKKASKHTVTIADCTNGSVSAKMGETALATNDQVLSGIQITLSNEAATGYKLAAYDVYKTDDATTKVTVTDGKFIMPEFDVTISATFELAKTLTSIEITNNATQTTFWQGEAFNHDGLKVTAHFDGAADEDVTDKVTVTGSTATSGTQTVTVSFKEGEVTKTATYQITVKAIPNTKETAYTVADAFDIIDKLGDTDKMYITGFVSQADLEQSSIDQYKNADYWISADGTTNGQQLEAFRGKYLDNTDFTSVNQIMVGDEVIIYGKLTKYGSTYEFAAGNYLVSLKRDKQQPELSYTTTEYNVNLGEAFTAPTLNNPHSLAVTYSSNDEDVATVAVDGAVTIKAAGTVKITASFAGNDDYVAGSASYTINITDPNQLEVTFDATQDKGNSSRGEGEITKSPITFACTDGILGNGSEYRIYTDADATFSAAEGYIITKVVLTSTAAENADRGPGHLSTKEGTYTYSGKVGTWVGEAYTVTLSASAQVRATTITVYYKQDNRVAAGLAWNPATISLTVGDAFTAPTFTNPNNVTGIEFTSSNDALATVSNAGVISLVSGKTGTATITATFAGDATYKPATVTCTITVDHKSEDVVILAKCKDQYYALAAKYVDGKNDVLQALPVAYINGKIYNVATDEQKASITWKRIVLDGKTTFQNGDNYLSAVNSAALKLEEEACDWIFENDMYKIEGADRTILYYATTGGFKNYSTSNMSADGVSGEYSSNAITVAPVFADGDAYHRCTTSGKFGTICLPFGGTITGAVLYECVGRETGKVYLGSVTTLAAGVPYIFQATATELAVYSDGTTATEAGSNNGLHGSFDNDTEVAVGNYILKDNKLCQAADICYVNANRAYIVMSEVPDGKPNKVAGRKYIGMDVQGENVETGVEDLFTTDAPVKVIENGQLIIIRDGVKYNVQGQKL